MFIYHIKSANVGEFSEVTWIFLD